MTAGTRDEAVAEAWSLLQDLMRAQRGHVTRVAAEFELAPAQMHALGAIEPGSPRPMSDLAQCLRCDNSNVTGIVDRLEARGLVERRPGDHDRRTKLVGLTPAGAALRKRLRARLAEPPPELARLGSEEGAALRDILRRALSDD